MESKVDFLVIGSGISGLMYALQVEKYGRVAILTKKEAINSNTNLAQGGIASAIGISDSFSLHVQDTISSGSGICDDNVVNKVISSGPKQIKKLIDIGVNFSKEVSGSSLDLGLEGGHSQNRIVHAKDMTGQEIEKVLLKKVKNIKNILLLEEHMVIDLIISENGLKRKLKCCGAYVLDRQTKDIKRFLSQVTILASGGAGKVYLHSSNPDIATGDGIAMGYRAGATVSNLEFVQFHPTCLYSPSARNFLISEAVRGYGAVLVNSNRIPFMQKYDPMKDLACRDIVTRAINTELKETGKNCVFLDISEKKTDSIKSRFPNLYQKCLKFGIDMTKDLIPVIPSAHYMCGGIVTDIHAETSIESLYAIGETACTGLHGANRLASNSLLEALVYSDFAAKQTIKRVKASRKILNTNISSEAYFFKKLNKDRLNILTHNLKSIRRLMWNYVGIVRSNKKLIKAQKEIANIKNETQKYFSNFEISSNLIEFKNIMLVSELIIKSAILRKESRGLHYNIDYPHQDDINWKINTIINKKMI